MVIFEAIIDGFGKEALSMLDNNMFIFFGNNVANNAPMLADYCVLLKNFKMHDTVKANDVISFGSQTYKITAIGDIAINNLKQLGHCMVNLDGAEAAELPGNMHLEKKDVPKLEKNMQVRIIRE